MSENNNKILAQIQEVIDSWNKKEIRSEIALIVIDQYLHPAKITEEDLKWAREAFEKFKQTKEYEVLKKIY